MLAESVVREIGLRRIAERRITDANGSTILRPVYVADLEFEGLVFRAVTVIGTPLPMRLALIGREVLNELFANFDGPSSLFSLRRP